jgi:5'-methylthioadenosine phosphorylase
LAKVAVISGSGLETILKGARIVDVETEYGKLSPVTIGTVGDSEVSFVPRHGIRHEVSPHKVNYRALILGLKNLGIEQIIATNAVGAINQKYAPGDIAVPADIMDFTKARQTTFCDNGPVKHIDVTEPYCPNLRRVLIENAKDRVKRVWPDSVMVCTEGPRFETPAEIRMFRLLGGDIVGMTSSPEVFLAREAGLCYASICFVSNMAAGMQARVSHEEVEEVASRIASVISEIVSQSIVRMRTIEPCSCRTSCAER